MFFACLRPVGARKAFLFGRAPVTVKRMPYIELAQRADTYNRNVRHAFLTSQAQFRSLADPVPTPSRYSHNSSHTRSSSDAFQHRWHSHNVRIPDESATCRSGAGVPAFRRRPGVRAPARAPARPPMAGPA